MSVKLVVLNKRKEFFKAKGKKAKSVFLNPDGTFKGGFEGCVKYQKSKGIDEKGATKLCSYIGRRAGKI